MTTLDTPIKELLRSALKELYGYDAPEEQLIVQHTSSDFQGDFTIVVFPFVRAARCKPEELAQALGEYICKESETFGSYNVANKGFCNLSLSDSYYKILLKSILLNPNYGKGQSSGKQIVLEYSSPNTNKPLHLGHIRNNLLGYATAQLLQAAGHEVKMVQIINDRGIHICKSMLAWQEFGAGETPQSSGLKGDHLVGKYYVRFEQEFQAEYKAWQSSEQGQEALQNWRKDEAAQKKWAKNLAKLQKKDEQLDEEEAAKSFFFKDVYKNTYFNSISPLGTKAKAMLQAWEEGNADVRALWQELNSWVYNGFEQSYQRLGVRFDTLYYESQTYIKGKALVEQELAKGKESQFFKKEDGSVWIDLSDAKLDQKVLLRSDGTSMYITQDLGTALLRFEDFAMDSMIYVVGNEQEYHFQVLFEILKRLGYAFASDCHHLSYGMVNLTTGRMKSREGTVVDADDLIEELYQEVRKEAQERASLDGLSPEEQNSICEQVAVSALKFFILKVEPQKTMVFDPKQSIELQGHTGPYILNAYVRTCALQRKAEQQGLSSDADYSNYELQTAERDCLALLQRYPSSIQSAAEAQKPSELANYLYNLAKSYHRLWNEVYLLDPEQPLAVAFRLQLSAALGQVLQAGGQILGMSMPERM